MNTDMWAKARAEGLSLDLTSNNAGSTERGAEDREKAGTVCHLGRGTQSGLLEEKYWGVYRPGTFSVGGGCGVRQGYNNCHTLSI